ncbi:CG10910 [Drosophila busckii]|uniref:CG10910 n=1 Tax=Drosophila busckii TaxID=30019 RepID=A0A0M4EKZ6_DROBS|nr:CG10910 [Drosophila busckii]
MEVLYKFLVLFALVFSVNHAEPLQANANELNLENTLFDALTGNLEAHVPRDFRSLDQCMASYTQSNLRTLARLGYKLRRCANVKEQQLQTYFQQQSSASIKSNFQQEMQACASRQCYAEAVMKVFSAVLPAGQTVRQTFQCSVHEIQKASFQLDRSFKTMEDCISQHLPEPKWNFTTPAWRPSQNDSNPIWNFTTPAWNWPGQNNSTPSWNFTTTPAWNWTIPAENETTTQWNFTTTPAWNWTSPIWNFTTTPSWNWTIPAENETTPQWNFTTTPAWNWTSPIWNFTTTPSWNWTIPGENETTPQWNFTTTPAWNWTSPVWNFTTTPSWNWTIPAENQTTPQWNFTTTPAWNFTTTPSWNWTNPAENETTTRWNFTTPAWNFTTPNWNNNSTTTEAPAHPSWWHKFWSDLGL